MLPDGFVATMGAPDGPVHLWFSLSYANYLVLPRSLMQSMPLEWQERMCACLDELDREFYGVGTPPYDVRSLARSPEVVYPYESCDECEGEGEREDGTRCHYCEGEGEIQAETRYETPEEVGFITDPIPHYNRGRTLIRRVEAPGA